MESDYDISQILEHLNELAELVLDGDDLQDERVEIREFVEYWRTLIEVSVAINIGWVELTKTGRDSLIECYQSFEQLCPGGIEYYFENPECTLNSFTRPRAILRTNEEIED